MCDDQTAVVQLCQPNKFGGPAPSSTAPSRRTMRIVPARTVIKRPWVRRLLRVSVGVVATAFAVMAYTFLTLPDVRALATINPPTTAFIELRAGEARAAGKKPRRVLLWIPYTRVSKNLTRAVLVAEDDLFW